MACNTFGIPTSPASKNNGLCRSKSSKDIKSQSTIRRSCSENHLVCSIDHTRKRPSLKNSHSSFLTNSLRSFLFDTETTRGVSIVEEDEDNGDPDAIKKRANWVERLLELRTRWQNRDQQEEYKKDGEFEEVISDYDCDCDCDCEVSYGEDDGEDDREKRSLDRESFSRFLVRVPLSDVKVFSRLAFLSNIAYVIPDIKPKDLKRRFGLIYVTSSLERKSEAAKTKDKVGQDFTKTPSTASWKQVDLNKRATRASVAYGIAASAASYVQSGGGEEGDMSLPRAHKSEVAAYVAASTMTAVVAAGEKEKLDAAKDLQSLHSSPCEWFVCDDPSTYTRCFVIQGSDSLASWQANLFFEPTKFEETQCLVHRGIYEAAKGMYEQMKPEIMEHLDKFGDRAKLQFTGHSLGGSLSLLVHLMLLTRNAVRPSALRPVVMFGSPFVFCGGHKMLEELGVDENQICCVIMHRDIVPRAFSCDYPYHVANLLKRLNGTFRSHPCLVQNKLLYSPIGKLYVLQPQESSSPPHPLLPQGCSIYELDKAKNGYTWTLLRAFLNNPHPLETLSHPSAYGSDGTILRDHDSSNYLKAVNGVLKLHKNNNPNYATKKETSSAVLLWPLLASPPPRFWSYSESNVFEGNGRLNKEIMTGV